MSRYKMSIYLRSLAWESTISCKSSEPLGNVVGMSFFPPYFDEKFDLPSAIPINMIRHHLEDAYSKILLSPSNKYANS